MHICVHNRFNMFTFATAVPFGVEIKECSLKVVDAETVPTAPGWYTQATWPNNRHFPADPYYSMPQHQSFS
jgi:hypothetical protein